MFFLLYLPRKEENEKDRDLMCSAMEGKDVLVEKGTDSGQKFWLAFINLLLIAASIGYERDRCFKSVFISRKCFMNMVTQIGLPHKKYKFHRVNVGEDKLSAIFVSMKEFNRM